MFPFKEIRHGQDILMQDIEKALEQKKHILCHAPTGLGKTVSALVPAIKHALKEKKKIIFVTPRHSQHTIVVETIKAIQNKAGVKIPIVDYIGKKSMCSIKGASEMYPSQFYEFCKKQKEERTCQFYTNIFDKKQTITTKAHLALKTLKERSPLSVEEVKQLMAQQELCPYEISSLLGKDATVIIADYYHVLSPSVRENFFRRINTTLENCVLIFDEAHHLPQRCRDLLSATMSSFGVKAAIREAKEAGAEDVAHDLKNILKVIEELSASCFDQKTLTKGQLTTALKMHIDDINSFLIELTLVADNIKEEKKRSFLAGIGEFLDAWEGENLGFVRFISREKNNRITIHYKCLDPTFIMKPILEATDTVIAMSATLEPLEMYKTVLGVPDTSITKSYPSPFGAEQRLTMIVPETTTKYNQRSPEQFKRIATIAASMTESIPGNCAIFFPSYEIRNEVNKTFQTLTTKTVFLEESQLTKEQRHELLERYKKYKDKGAVLLGIMGGSFAEGIDLPGDLLKSVIVVGVPLTRPNIETKALIEYYDKLFNKGWDYGYIMPAMTKCLQGAGRCIRTTEDKGIVIFLDTRFTWHSYYKCFPREWATMVTTKFPEKIQEFLMQ